MVRMSRSREAPGWVYVHDCDRCESSSECLSRFRPVARALGSLSVPGLRERCCWWFARYQLDLFGGAQSIECSAPEALPSMPQTPRTPKTHVFVQVASVYGKQCQAHTHRLGGGRFVYEVVAASDSFSKNIRDSCQ